MRRSRLTQERPGTQVPGEHCTERRSVRQHRLCDPVRSTAPRRRPPPGRALSFTPSSAHDSQGEPLMLRALNFQRRRGRRPVRQVPSHRSFLGLERLEARDTPAVSMLSIPSITATFSAVQTGLLYRRWATLRRNQHDRRQPERGRQDSGQRRGRDASSAALRPSPTLPS